MIGFEDNSLTSSKGVSRNVYRTSYLYPCEVSYTLKKLLHERNFMTVNSFQFTSGVNVESYVGRSHRREVAGVYAGVQMCLYKIKLMIVCFC